MEGSSHQYLMYVKKREQNLKSSSHLEAPPIAHHNMNYSWEERAFAEDAARILSGSMWPPRSYSCTFCKREFNSAQALGGHMNIHRRDRARLKQNLTPHHNYKPLHHQQHKNDYFKSLLGNHHNEISTTQIDCGFSAYYSSPSPTITTTRLSCVSTQQDCGQNNFSSPYSSSSNNIILGHMGSCNSEQEGVVNAGEYNFNGMYCDNYVETSLSVGLASIFDQKSSPTTVSCGDRANLGCKRLKTLSHKPCSSVEIPLSLALNHHHGIEELDLELRLGSQQKVR